MSENETITITREELYQQIWTKPMIHLCKQYGLSDVGLRKVCKRYDIPCPQIGYWAKKEYGKAPPQTPLPKHVEKEFQTIFFCLLNKDGDDRTSPSIYDDDIMELLKVAQNLPEIIVPEQLRNPHPLTQATKAVLMNREPGDKNLVWSGERDQQTLNIEVSKDSRMRALRFMDTLIKTIEKIGGKVAVAKDGWQPKTTVIFAGEKVATVRLRERYNQRPHQLSPKEDRIWAPKWDCVPNGMLLLDDGPSSYGRPYCQDTPKKARIEDQINGVVIRFVEIAGQMRIRRRVREEEHRQRVETEKRRADLRERQEREQKRVEAFLHEAECWQRSQTLRKYIANVRTRVIEQRGSIDHGSELDQWLQWATHQADRMDPLVLSPPSVLDETL